MRKLVCLILILSICASFSGCVSNGMKTDAVSSADTTAAPAPADSPLPLRKTYIDRQIITTTIENSIYGKKPTNFSRFDYIFNRILLSRYANNELKRKFIADLYVSALTCTENVYPPYGLKITEDELDIIMELLSCDAPELLNLTNEYGYLASDKGYVTQVNLRFGLGQERHIYMLNRVFFYLDSVFGNEKTDDCLYLERTLHDALCAGCVFEDTENCRNAYGACIEGRAVCEGYAEAFSLGMMFMGIPCCVLTGDADNGSETELHAWNAILLDDELYYVDVTWDDAREGDDYTCDYSYFNTTDDMMAKSHSIGTECASALDISAESDEYNFYKYYNLIARDGEVFYTEMLDRYLREGYTEFEMWMRFEDEDAYRAFDESFDDITDAWFESHMTTDDWYYYCTCNDDMLTFAFYIEFEILYD